MQSPVAFAEIRNTVSFSAQVVRQLDGFAVVVELAGPVADHVRHARIIRGEHRGIGGNDQIAAGGNDRVGEIEGYSLGKLPAREVYRVRAGVIQLDPLLPWILRHLGRRMIHDFVDQHLGTQDSCGKHHKHQYESGKEMRKFFHRTGNYHLIL